MKSKFVDNVPFNMQHINRKPLNRQVLAPVPAESLITLLASAVDEEGGAKASFYTDQPERLYPPPLCAAKPVIWHERRWS